MGLRILVIDRQYEVVKADGEKLVELRPSVIGARKHRWFGSSGSSSGSNRDDISRHREIFSGQAEAP